VASAACCSKSEVKGGGSGADVPPPAKPSFTVFALAETRGQIGPCGCTSDPLGDISRTAKLVEEARAKGPVLVVDAGSLLYGQNPVPKHLEAQEDLKADLLTTIYKDQLQVAAVGLGPADLAKGPAEIRFPRVAVNVVDPAVKLQPASVINVGNVKVGVFGVVATDAIKDVKLDDPVAAGKRAVDTLKKAGAQSVIALVQATSKRDAVAMVRDIGGIDIAIAGLGAVAPEPDRIDVEPTKVGDGWLVIPANRGQIVSRLDVYIHGGGGFVDAVGRGAAAAKIAQLDHQIASLDAELAKFKQDKDADPKFVAAKQSERDAAAAQKKKLEAQPLEAPAKGNYFTLEQLRINKTLACSVPVRDAIRGYDLAAGEANVKAAADTPVPAPKKGQAGYVGTEACSDCHQDQVDQWKTTRHASAWKTLVDRGQQFDYECIGCHVTGWQQPGGSNLAHNDNLRDVQCETCHGPGSIHVAKGGLEKPFAIVRNPKPELCASQCHTKEHSDTFQYEAYLRDIVGQGHGAEMRTKLGDGPTGHELRSTALDKAGRTLGAGCVK
ncbi:MAG TPA: multiheme c-type cytochrome, partial [Kofleriaceae bacterium]|nr:multiheme c-type cytochrome [Kofleriaceae bacterium]